MFGPSVASRRTSPTIILARAGASQAPVMSPDPKEPITGSHHKASAEAVGRAATTEPASTKAPASVMKRRATEAEQRLRKERGALRRGFGAAIANM